MTDLSEFNVIEGNIYHTDSNGRTNLVANFLPKVEKWIQYVNDEGTVEDRYTLSINYPYEANFVLRADDFKPAKLSKIFSGALNIEKLPLFKRYLAGILTEFMEGGNAQRNMTYTGMTVIDGKRMFLNNGGAITADGLLNDINVETLSYFQDYRFIRSDISLQEAATPVLSGLTDTVPSRVAVPVLSYLMLTPLMDLLRGCGKEPDFILAIIGRTGSGKTSLAKALLSLQGEFKGNAPASYEGTANSIRTKLSGLNDLVLLLDDRRPSINPKDKANFENIERIISSTIGDRTVRDRCETDGSIIQTKPSKALLLTTGETLHENSAESTVARFVDVSLHDNDMNWEALTKLQNSGRQLNTFNQAYITWVIRNYDRLKDSISGLLQQCREDLSLPSAHKRVATNYAALLFSYRMLMVFCVENGLLTQQQASEKDKEAITIFTESAQAQKEEIQSSNQADLFLSAVRSLMDTGKIYFAPVRRGVAPQVKNGHVGYVDEECYWFIPGAAMKAVVQHYKQLNQIFSFEEKRVFKMLKDQGKLKIEAGSRGLKPKKMINNKSKRMYAIPIEYIDTDEAENTDEPAPQEQGSDKSTEMQLFYGKLQ